MCFVAAKVSLLQHTLAVVNCLTIDYGLFTFANLTPMQALLKTGGDLRLEEGHLVLTRLTAEEIPPAAKALQEEINRRLPAVDLTDILVEVDNWVGFTQHLPGLEHAARGEDHPTRLLATLLALGWVHFKLSRYSRNLV